MRGVQIFIASCTIAALLSACAAGSSGGRRGLDPTEMNDGGLRQAPPPPDEGEPNDADPA